MTASFLNSFKSSIDHLILALLWNIYSLIYYESVSSWYQETMTGSYYLWWFLTKLCWHIKHTRSSPCGGFHSPRCTTPYCPSPSSLRSLRTSDGIRQASLSVRPQREAFFSTWRSIKSHRMIELMMKID